MIFFIDKPLSRSFARDAVEAIVLDSDSVTSDSEPDRIPKMSNSLKNIDSKTLQAELARRGYDFTRIRDNKTTAKIVKIG